MNAALLLEHYARIADAPNAFARLRQFVLDLAVRGKLVDQDARDEPASELLKRIAAERSRLVKAGEIRKPKPLPAVDDPLFDLPFNWAWVPIREITSDRGQAIPGAPFTYIDVTAINKEAGVVAKPKVIASADAPSRARKITQKGDVIYSCVRPYLLNVAVIEQDFDPAPIASTAFAILNGYGMVLPRYIWIVLRTPFMIECVEATQRGQAYPAINDADFAVLPFPLPPLAEQHRIVAKVDELMALCDQLEAARAEREAARDTFTLSTLAKLNAPDPEAFGQDVRFALANLPTLTTRPDQIKQLRQTILNLAVRGKLVEQDPSESPIEIRSVNAEAKAPFDLPTSWRWAEFSDVATFENGDRSSKYPNRSDYVSSGVPWINTGHIQPDGTLSPASMHYITEKKFTSLGGGKIIPGDLVYCLRGATFGKTAFIEPFDRGAIASSLMIIRPGRSVDRRFVYFYLISPFGRKQLRRFDNGTAQPNLSSSNVKRYLVPLPPLAEQHRIVVKVDELMAVCDGLEASLATGEQTRSRLLEAVLHNALEPA
ncbi:restriction endonuclease subunit S [Altererythrobacter xixiisoli]|uniref:Restriction endonuclease subunit S n=1 Tax=Croceibacterium xixiisoli TaxID=1476466 RepID=A0A6I4TSN1_9SPHN|nr:restriction endonuclease subunit S [Croceibacterium xixiisoli]MXO98131.1 restriction endonuclease subunit S [Croceibacterium xixiisoli]